MSRPEWLRPLSIAGALALLGALVLPTAAQAAPGDDVLVFSNENVVDIDEEYLALLDDIASAGYVAHSFDGGDGSAGAWLDALEDMEVFALSEQEKGEFYDPDSPPAWLSAAAWDALIGWVRDGGTLLLSGTCDNTDGSAVLLSAAVGVDYDEYLFYECYMDRPAERWIDDDALPSQLPRVNATYPLNLSEFSDAQLAPLTVWHATPPDMCGYGEWLAAGEFAAGDGRVIFDAWDYYLDEDDDHTAWSAVLAGLLNGSASGSTWVQGAPPVVPAPALVPTASGQLLYTISETYCDGDLSLLYAVNPGTAIAAPVSGELIEGYPSQGATDPTSGISYLPLYIEYDEEVYDQLLLTVDRATGAFTEIAEFTSDIDYLNEIFSLAIGADGSAYLFADGELGSDSIVGLFALDLSDASLTLIAEIDHDALDEPNGFAFNPADGKFYAFEEDDYTLFEVDVLTGELTLIGVLDSPSINEESSDVTALQITADGTFYVVWDEVYSEEWDDDGGMLASFTLADISGGVITPTEIGVLTDDVMESYSLLLGPAERTMPATGADVAGLVLPAVALLGLGLVLVGIRRSRRAA